jgi:hypothetical protein
MNHQLGDGHKNGLETRVEQRMSGGRRGRRLLNFFPVVVNANRRT